MWLYLNSDPKLDAQRQRLSSVVAADLLPSLEGLELGACGKVNVYLTYSTMKRKNQSHYSDTSAWFVSSPLHLPPDGVIRSVPLSDQRLGETEERRRARELHGPDPSVAFPWQRAKELHPCSPEQQCHTGPMYGFSLGTKDTHPCFFLDLHLMDILYFTLPTSYSFRLDK